MQRYRIGSYPFFTYFKPGSSPFQVSSFFRESERTFDTMRAWMEQSVQKNDPEYQSLIVEDEHTNDLLE